MLSTAWGACSFPRRSWEGGGDGELQQIPSHRQGADKRVSEALTTVIEPQWAEFKDRRKLPLLSSYPRSLCSIQLEKRVGEVHSCHTDCTPIVCSTTRSLKEA